MGPSRSSHIISAYRHGANRNESGFDLHHTAVRANNEKGRPVAGQPLGIYLVFAGRLRPELQPRKVSRLPADYHR